MHHFHFCVEETRSSVFNRSRIKLVFVFVHQVSKKYVSKELAKEIHAKAAPFVKWLKEAEEESEGSEEEEEEEDENVEVTDGPLFIKPHETILVTDADLYFLGVKGSLSATLRMFLQTSASK